MTSDLDRITEEQRQHLDDYAEEKFREAAEDVARKALDLLVERGVEEDEITVDLGSWRPHFVAVDQGRLLICMDQTLKLKPHSE